MVMSTPPIQPLPRWLKRNVPKGGAGHFTAGLIQELGLQTVCDHAKCPNRMECYSRKTATFMILGDVCTRGCRFCSVKKGRPRPPDPDEPRRVAEAVRRLGLKHVVITCVTRDDLPDGGAEHFVRTIEEIRKSSGVGVRESRFEVQDAAVVRVESDRLAAASTRRREDLKFGEAPSEPRTPNPESRSPIPEPTIEVLPSDFAGNAAAVEKLAAAKPDVYNHNVETVPRLFSVVRGRWEIKGSELFSVDGRVGWDKQSAVPPRSGNNWWDRASLVPPYTAPSRTFPSYRWTLEMFRRIHRADPSMALKSGMMLGLGETTDELLETWADLLAAGCRMLTLGQYLQPSLAQTPVVRYVPPEEFERLGELARRMGFEQVASGPFVRSSYHAGEMFNASLV